MLSGRVLNATRQLGAPAAGDIEQNGHLGRVSLTAVDAAAVGPPQPIHRRWQRQIELLVGRSVLGGRSGRGSVAPPETELAAGANTAQRRMQFKRRGHG